MERPQYQLFVDMPTGEDFIASTHDSPEEAMDALSEIWEQGLIKTGDGNGNLAFIPAFNVKQFVIRKVGG
jgi:hypothetical protein